MIYNVVLVSAIQQSDSVIYTYICIYIWRRKWHPTPVLLPGKSHGQRSLVGYRPWGSKKSDTTERLPFHFSLSCIGEENSNPLQCSCLENPRDGWAWWAAVYGVAQSRTRLKWLSSSQCPNQYGKQKELAWLKIPFLSLGWELISGCMTTQKVST